MIIAAMIIRILVQDTLSLILIQSTRNKITFTIMVLINQNKNTNNISKQQMKNRIRRIKGK